MAEVGITISSVLAAPREEVWARVTSQQGLDHEFRPVLRMRFPTPYRGGTIADLPVGEPVGRAWLLLGGMFPVDYDDLCLAEVVVGSHFLERSKLGSARRWEHERRLEDVVGGSTRLTDRLSFEPRRGVPPAVARALVGAFFGHRHRRLRAWFTPA
jgi:ligand-binding SRPBCC domain-containing protein